MTTDAKNHYCYVIKSEFCERYYIGYTVDPKNRIRKHNGEICGGAKRTKKYRPWNFFFIISGFLDNHSALRFEARLQKLKISKCACADNCNFNYPPKSSRSVVNILRKLFTILNQGDGSVAKKNKQEWPHLTINWYLDGFFINHPTIANIYKDQPINHSTCI